MAKSTNLSFRGGSVSPGPGESTSVQVRNVFLHEIAITDAGQESHIYALFDKAKPIASAPFFEPVSTFDLADWCIRGDAVQVDLSEVMASGTDRYSGLLQDANLETDPAYGMYVHDCTLRTMLKRGTSGVRFAWFALYLITDQAASVTYLATPVHDNPETLDVPDHKVQVEQTDTPNYLAYKIMGDGSTVNVDIVRETSLGQPIDPFLRISARKTTGVIKWSDVQEVQDSDYTEFIDRIAADIADGVAPVLLDDVNGSRVVALYEFSDSVAVFRASPDLNGQYYHYIIRSDSAIIQHRQITIPMRNSGIMSILTGLVYVKNNTVADYTYDGNNPLDFVFSGEANFEVTIKSTAATDGTVNVYKQENGLLTPMMQSVAGGNTVEAGKTYQLTCSNDGWTLAEFETSVAVAKTIIGDKVYDAVKIGNLWWTVPNLDLTWTGLIVDDTSGWDGTEKAWYFDNMRETAQSKQWGLLYNHEAVKHLVDNPNLLNGWRVPTKADWEALITAAGGSSAGTALRATTQWTNEQTPATDAYGFAALPAMRCMEYSGGVTFSNPSTDENGYFRTATAQSDATDWITIINGGNAVVGPMPSGNSDGYSLRLCRDAEA